jgi:hypothetical protein
VGRALKMEGIRQMGEFPHESSEFQSNAELPILTYITDLDCSLLLLLLSSAISYKGLNNLVLDNDAPSPTRQNNTVLDHDA